MSMGKFIAFIAIIASILIPQSAFSDDAVFRTIPFYNLRDPEQKAPKLQLKVKEKVYPPDAVYTLQEMLERAKDPFKTPEDNLLGHIGYAAAGKVEEVERFYYPGEKNVLLGMTPVQLLKFTIEAYKGVERVRLLRSWHYGNHRKIMVEFLPPTREVNITLYGFKKIGDKYYKTLGQGGIVSRILGYIMVNYRKGVGNRFDPVELPYSLTYYAKDINDITIKENPATLYFTGKAYGFEDGWVPAGDVDPVLRFVHDAMNIATNGTDEEYLALFTGKTKEYMEMLLELYRRKGEITNMTFRSFRYGHSGEYMKKDIKHIFTLDLGTEYIHYYRLKGESELRYMIIGNKGGKLWLTVLKDNDMPDDTMTRNIKKLIKDENFLNKIIEIWQAKNKRVGKDKIGVTKLVSYGGDGVSMVNLPRTGQTKNYATGDDGQLQKGITWPSPRFVVGTGAEADCVTDNLTGLMWVKSPDKTKRKWKDALTYANDLSLCDYNDWRLPNIKEIGSLINYGEVNTSVWLNEHGFTNVQLNYYWSSTTYANTDRAWSMTIWDGNEVVSNKKDFSKHVWPVRGGQ